MNVEMSSALVGSGSGSEVAASASDPATAEASFVAVPMLQFDSHPKLVQYIKLTCQEMGFGSETVRAPRLPLVGEERERILKIVRDSAATRPE